MVSSFRDSTSIPSSSRACTRSCLTVLPGTSIPERPRAIEVLEVTFDEELPIIVALGTPGDEDVTSLERPIHLGLELPEQVDRDVVGAVRPTSTDQQLRVLGDLERDRVEGSAVSPLVDARKPGALRRRDLERGVVQDLAVAARPACERPPAG